MQQVADILTLTRYIDQEYIAPIPVIQIGGKTVATDGNFITISGLPKSRKTTFAAYMVASALSNRSVFDMNVCINQTDNIVFVDTEQSNHDFSRMIKNIKYASGLKTLPSNFNAFLFRKYDPDQIFSAIDQIMLEYCPKILFIDNLTELALNPNDIPEAKSIIQKLKRITAEYNCVIVNLLHLGKNSLNTTGNLGSYADRAAQSTLKVVYDKDTGASTLDATYMRSDGHFSPISIIYNEDLKTYEQTNQIPTETNTRKFKLDEISEDDHKVRISLIFESIDFYSYSDLIEQIKIMYGVGTNIAKQKILPLLLSMQLVINNKGVYQKNKKVC